MSGRVERVVTRRTGAVIGVAIDPFNAGSTQIYRDRNAVSRNKYLIKAGTTVDGVVTVVQNKDVIACATDQSVGSQTIADCIVVQAAIDNIVAIVAAQIIVQITAGNGVVTLATLYQRIETGDTGGVQNGIVCQRCCIDVFNVVRGQIEGTDDNAVANGDGIIASASIQ